MTSPDRALFALQQRVVVAPLEACGWHYQLHETRSGEPYAAFRWRTDGLPPLTCTVVLHGGAWRLTAHEPAMSGATGAITARNGRLPLVRGFSVPDGDGLNAVLSLRLRPSRITPDGLVDLLVHLAASVAFLRGEHEDPPPLPLMDSGDEPGFLAQPPDLMVEEPAPGWRTVMLPARDLSWARLVGRPGLLDRLHDWTPVGTLVAYDTVVAGRVTTLSGDPGIPDALTQAAEDARRLVDAARLAG